jgi:hypothetical protein
MNSFLKDHFLLQSYIISTTSKGYQYTLNQVIGVYTTFDSALDALTSTIRSSATRSKNIIYLIQTTIINRELVMLHDADVWISYLEEPNKFFYFRGINVLSRIKETNGLKLEERADYEEITLRPIRAQRRKLTHHYLPLVNDK